MRVCFRLRAGLADSEGSALDGVGGQRHAPAAILAGKTRYPLYRWLGGHKAGLNGCEKWRSHRISIPDLPVLSESLYRLSHPGRHAHKLTHIYRMFHL